MYRLVGISLIGAALAVTSTCSAESSNQQVTERFLAHVVGPPLGREVELPVDTADEAVRFALRIPQVIASMAERESMGTFHGWNVVAERSTRGDTKGTWIVRISTAKVLPRYQCRIPIQPTGETQLEGSYEGLHTGCRYLK